jgi:hypothetical protein
MTAQFDIKHSGRCFGSKSAYVSEHPGHHVGFNAVLLSPDGERIWCGDIDITLDYPDISMVAASRGQELFVLREGDYDENMPAQFDRAMARFQPNGRFDMFDRFGERLENPYQSA